jgi:hypothetical protein
MKLSVKKLYLGRAELRDYNVKDCIEKNENIQIEYEKNVMTLSPSELKTKLVNISQTFESKNGGKSYKLYAYKWNPDEIDY